MNGLFGGFAIASGTNESEHAFSRNYAKVALENEHADQQPFVIVRM